MAGNNRLDKRELKKINEKFLPQIEKLKKSKVPCSFYRKAPGEERRPIPLKEFPSTLVQIFNKNLQGVINEYLQKIRKQKLPQDARLKELNKLRKEIKNWYPKEPAFKIAPEIQRTLENQENPKLIPKKQWNTIMVIYRRCLEEARKNALRTLDEHIKYEKERPKVTKEQTERITFMPVKPSVQLPFPEQLKIPENIVPESKAEKEFRKHIINNPLMMEEFIKLGWIYPLSNNPKLNKKEIIKEEAERFLSSRTFAEKNLNTIKGKIGEGTFQKLKWLQEYVKERLSKSKT